MTQAPARFCEDICDSPGIWPNWRSSGAVTGQVAHGVGARAGVQRHHLDGRIVDLPGSAEIGSTCKATRPSQQNGQHQQRGLLTGHQDKYAAGLHGGEAAQLLAGAEAALSLPGRRCGLSSTCVRVCPCTPPGALWPSRRHAISILLCFCFHCDQSFGPNSVPSCAASCPPD